MALLVYGSYGYTGRLVVEAALDRDLDPVLAGRDAEALADQAAGTGLATRAFPVEAAGEHLADIEAVLNCAGPFVHTYESMVEACLDAGVHYADITGEIEVFEDIADRGDDARSAGVALLPGVGFDVVPTDCLAAHLADALPEATHLRLAFDGLAAVSRGTARSVVEHLGGGGRVREDGRLRAVPPAHRRRRVDVAGDGRRRHVATIPWGDVATASHTTGIPNVEVYAPMRRAVARALALSGPLGPLLDSRLVQAPIGAAVGALVDGPDAETRAGHRVHVWGEVVDEAGERRVARLGTPDAYELTAETAIESARRLADGAVAPGFRTPAGAFGPDYILGFDGVSREDAHDPSAS